MLYTEGSAGEAVRDIQRRLLAFGASIDESERARRRFGPSTTAAVRAFQQRRGLISDGIVGPQTWRELVEASWNLGDRVLYVRSPQMRGDDVRELQQRLSKLGFDPGRIDGILGPQTIRVVVEFQRNYGLPPDGIIGASTIRALIGMPSLGGDTPVTRLREREHLRRLPPTLAGLTIVVDPGHGPADPGHSGPGGLHECDVAFAIARRLEAALAASGVAVFLTRDDASTPGEAERGALANTLGADLYVAIHMGGSADPHASGAAAFYFGTDVWESDGGRRLAETIMDHLAGLGLADGRSHAKTWGVLRETRMPAVQVEPCYITNPDEAARLTEPEFQRRIAEAVFAAIRTFAVSPIPA
ncbi:MAG TPA: N-acetylmuramoyl-L-alanine amidase [Actinomycetota bacterium]|nr:N-acetylmuramoyl-L-alanine amidase [Actinomycetota bacterium]